MTIPVDETEYEKVFKMKMAMAAKELANGQT